MSGWRLAVCMWASVIFGPFGVGARMGGRGRGAPERRELDLERARAWPRAPSAGAGGECRKSETLFHQ